MIISMARSFVQQYTNHMNILALQAKSILQSVYEGTKRNAVCHCYGYYDGNTIRPHCDDCEDTRRLPIPSAEVIQSE